MSINASFTKSKGTNTLLMIVFALTLITTPLSLSAHWVSVGPYGGNVTCFAGSDTNFYLGTKFGGVYSSANKQANVWKYINYKALGSGKINALLVHGKNIIAATADSGIYLTLNRGLNWHAYNTGLTSKKITALTVSGALLFAGTKDNGVFISADSGASWKPANTGLTNKVVTALLALGSTVYAATDNGGVFISTDNANSWQAANTGLTDLKVTALTATNNELYAGTTTGVYASPLTSISWISVNIGINHQAVNSLHANNGKIYAATNANIYVTANAATGWLAIKTGSANDTVNVVYTFANKLFAGTSKGVYVTDTTTINWLGNNQGLNNLKSKALYAAGNFIATATDNGLYVCRNYIASPVYQLSNQGLTDSLNVTCITAVNTHLFASTQHAGVFFSADSGRSWRPVNAGLTNLAVKKLVVTKTRIFAATFDGAVFSTDKINISWEQASTGLPAPLDITALATDSTVVFLAANGKGVYKNTDGTNWVAFNDGLTNLQLTALAVSSGNVYVSALGAGVATSAIANPSWTAMNSGLPILNILSLSVSGQYVVAGYKGGVHATYNKGISWLPMEEKVHIPVYADILAIAFTSNRIFAATFANSLYSNSKSELPEIPAGINEWTNADAIRIYPNPNSGTFKLDYTIANDVVTAVEIYTITGKLLSRFVNKQQQYELNYPQGMYLVQVVTQAGVHTKKLIIE